MDILQEIERYIKVNPNFLNREEKEKLRKEFLKYVKNPQIGVQDVLLEFFENIRSS